jgi:hypothetical protein
MYLIVDEKLGIVVDRSEEPTEALQELAVTYHVQNKCDVGIYERVAVVTPEHAKKRAQHLADDAVRAVTAEAQRIQKWNDEQQANRNILEEASRKESERIAKERAKSNPPG